MKAKPKKAAKPSKRKKTMEHKPVHHTPKHTPDPESARPLGVQQAEVTGQTARKPHPVVAEGEVERLLFALHVIAGLNDHAEARRVANVAIAGGKHGHEIT